MTDGESESKDVVLILNGSFNPITKAHVRLAQKAVEYTQNVLKKQVIKVLFSPVHEQYKFKKLLPSKVREELIRLSLENTPPSFRDIAEVNHDELYADYPLYTYEVMQNLRKRYPHNQIYLVCGADLVAGMLIPSYWPEVNVRRVFAAVDVMCFQR